MPLFGWGPLTHAYINDRVLDHIDQNGGFDDNIVTTAFSKPELRNVFVLTAGYPDVIKFKGFLKGDTSYDYAHNPIPCRYYGQPAFSSDLYNKFRDIENEEMIVTALSWRSHQVSDVYAHLAPLDRFWGYANSENFFGPFWHEVLDHIGEDKVGDLPGSFYRADHWISELIIDLFCYLEKGAEWGRKMLGSPPDKILDYLPELSAEYIDKHKDILDTEYRDGAPIEINEIIRGRDFSNTINAATWRYYDSLINKRSAETVMRMIMNHGQFANLKGVLESVAYQASLALIKPSDEWKAPELNDSLFLAGSNDYKKVFPKELTPDQYSDYYSEHLEKEWKKFKPARDGIVKLVLEKMPISPLNWVVLKTPLITSGNAFNRTLLPSSSNPYALSLRYTFNIRNSKSEDFMQILRKTLEETDIIASSQK